MSAQEVFDRAIKYYDEAMNHIEALSVKIRADIPEFSTKEAKREFDEVLQACLLHIAVADGFAIPVEMEFIDKITEQGDILLNINHTFGFSFSWDDIPNLSDDLTRRLLQMAKKIALKDMEIFAPLPLLVDLSEPSHEATGKLGEYLALICVELSKVDGMPEECEKEKTLSIIKDLFVDSSVNVLQNLLKKD